MSQRLWVLRVLAVWVLGVGGLPLAAASVSGCASGTTTPSDAGGRDAPRDGAAIDAPRSDTGPVDAAGTPDAPPVDAPGACSPACMGLQYCMAGTCVDYPACRPDMTCPVATDVCISRRCVPGADDPDGDGSPASADCDELDPTRYPGATEVCNNRDENCNGAPDDGDPAALCESDPVGGVCLSGTCGCPAGVIDIDRAVPGCECTIAPAPGMGDTCAAAIDLGSVSDAGAGAMMVATGNALPAGREVWYRVRAVDSADTTCDNFHFRAQLTVNPGAAFEVAVIRGVCGDAISCDPPSGGPQVDYSWSTDFRATIGGMLAGECPCSSAARTNDDISSCSDNSADYLVRVRRVSGAAPACMQYTLEVSNGVYST